MDEFTVKDVLNAVAADYSGLFEAVSMPQFAKDFGLDADTVKYVRDKLEQDVADLAEMLKDEE